MNTLPMSTTKLAIMQPYVFPYIGYFQLIDSVDKFMLLDDVTYIQKGWINRNRILVNNEAHLFTVPLHQASQNVKISDTKLHSGFDKWCQKFYKTLLHAYGRAPYYQETLSLLHKILDPSPESISILAHRSIEKICEHLKLDTSIIPSSAVYSNDGATGQSRILDLCVQERATDYHNAIGGRVLYHKDNFALQGIRLKFLQSRHIDYPQFKLPFTPWLSVIDVLMFNDVPTVQELVKEYDLVDG